MESTERIDKNRLFTYILIAVGMVSLIVLGVAWSRNRANQLAQTNAAPPAAEQEQSPNQEQPAATTPTPDNQHIASTHTTSQDSATHVVPAAGPTDTVLVIGSLSAVMFMGVRFLQARRHVRNAYRSYFTF